MSLTGVFGYGSLASPASAATTLGRARVELVAVTLRGWRRSWTQARDNLRSEKGFALANGSLPPWVLGLNLEPAEPEAETNGVLIAVAEGELARLDRREVRYDRVEVRAQIEPASAAAGFESVVTYVAKPEQYAPRPPSGAVILAAYATTVESAFAALGDEQLRRYRRSTQPPPVPVVEAVLVRDRIPSGNPREW